MVHNRQSFSNSEEFHVVRLAPIAIQFVVALLLAFKARQISAYFLDVSTGAKNDQRDL